MARTPRLSARLTSIPHWLSTERQSNKFSIRTPNDGIRYQFLIATSLWAGRQYVYYGGIQIVTPPPSFVLFLLGCVLVDLEAHMLTHRVNAPNDRLSRYLFRPPSLATKRLQCGVKRGRQLCYDV